MESEKWDHVSPGGGPAEPSSLAGHPGEGRDQSRAAKPAREAGEPLTGAPRRDNALPARTVEPERCQGGSAPGGGTEGESERPAVGPGVSYDDPAAVFFGGKKPRMRGLNVQVEQAGFDLLKTFQHHSRLPHNQFFGVALMLGATHLISQLRPDMREQLAKLWDPREVQAVG